MIVTDPSSPPVSLLLQSSSNLTSTVPPDRTGQLSVKQLSSAYTIAAYCGFVSHKICPNLWELLVFYILYLILVHSAYLGWIHIVWLVVWEIHDLYFLLNVHCRYNTLRLIKLNDRIIVGISVWELARSCCYDDLQLVLFWLNHSDLLWIFRQFKYHSR